jgi:hypothetical protein
MPAFRLFKPAHFKSDSKIQLITAASMSNNLVSYRQVGKTGLRVSVPIVRRVTFRLCVADGHISLDQCLSGVRSGT